MAPNLSLDRSQAAQSTHKYTHGTIAILVRGKSATRGVSREKLEISKTQVTLPAKFNAI